MEILLLLPSSLVAVPVTVHCVDAMFLPNTVSFIVILKSGYAA
jgi:hypothetical protein